MLGRVQLTVVSPTYPYISIFSFHSKARILIFHTVGRSDAVEILKGAESFFSLPRVIFVFIALSPPYPWKGPVWLFGRCVGRGGDACFFFAFSPLGVRYVLASLQQLL